MRRHSLTYLLAAALLLIVLPSPTTAAHVGAGVIPQGAQTDAAYARSVSTNQVGNVMATTQQVSCYTPEAPYAANDGPNDGYTGETPCGGASTTGEDLGPYATQAGSNPGYPAATPMLVKDHSESDLRVDPTNPNHLIGSSKWFSSAEGYNHLLGFYESFDGGATWPVQGHIPGYEGWTDNTDPVGAFDSYGNYYEFILPYQFFYNKDGSHNFKVGAVNEPNPAQPAEAVAVAVRPHGSTTAAQWVTTHAGHLDTIATYNSTGREPDKQWITIDTNKTLPNGQPNPNYNTIYTMWVLFDSINSKPYYATAKALPDGAHTDWTAPQLLPTVSGTASDTYLLPHVAPDGTVYTTVTNFPSGHGHCCANIGVDYSTDGGQTFQGPLSVARNVQPAPLTYANTTFRDGIEDTFAVGPALSAQNHYPLYVSWEDYSTGHDNIVLAASTDGGRTWSSPIQISDNASPVDEFQPNLAVAPSGAVSVAFYDRRLACPTVGAEATAAGLALDTVNPAYSGALPPYGATNYCINASVQFYSPTLVPYGHNIRLTQHTWDPQLNAPHAGSASDNAYTFIGDYFGNITAGNQELFTFVSTYDAGSNPAHDQQQGMSKKKNSPRGGKLREERGGEWT